MESLRHNRNFKWFFSANLVSHIGSGMTMIGVPWFLVTQDGGEQLLGMISLITTIIMVFISPYAGILIDRFPRVRLHRSFDLIGFLLLTSFGIAGLFFDGYSSLLLMLIYVISAMYNMFHYPTIFAISQEIFSQKNYGKVNSVMEVQGQAGTMLAGAIGSVLITAFGLSTILILDGVTFLIAFILFGLIRYTPEVKQKTEVRHRLIADMVEGWNFLKEKPMMIVFFLSTMTPFTVVIVTNFLFPIYIANTLQADASVFATYELIYAGGAVLAGFSVHVLTKKISPLFSIYLTILFFTIAILSVAFIPSVGLFLGMSFLMGWGNAGTRINRKTLMMNLVPTSIIGRVNSFYSLTGVLLRILLISLFTATIHTLGASYALLCLGLLLVLSLIGVFVSKGVYEEEISPQSDHHETIAQTQV